MKKENYSFKQACAVVGGQSAMARLLGVSPPSVNQWIKGVPDDNHTWAALR